MRLLWILSLVVMAAGSSAMFPEAARAQFHRQSKLPNSEDPEQVRKALDKFARCTAKGKEELARKLVLSDEMPPGLFGSGFLNPDCLSGVTGLKLSPDALRGPIAEYLIEKDLDGPAPIDVTKPEDHAVLLDEEAARELAKRSIGTRKDTYRADRILRPLGQCLLVEDQPGVIALLDSKVSHRSEEEAADALRPALQNCTDAGSTLILDMTALRAGVAISYYREAVAEKEQPPTD